MIRFSAFPAFAGALRSNDKDIRVQKESSRTSAALADAEEIVTTLSRSFSRTASERGLFARQG
jgi:hypothetical protein